MTFLAFCLLLGHFLGNHSVLDILRQEGYEIIHVPPDHQETVTEWVSTGECENICIILLWRLNNSNIIKSRALYDSSFVQVINHRLHLKPLDPDKMMNGKSKHHSDNVIVIWTVKQSICALWAFGKRADTVHVDIHQLGRSTSILFSLESTYLTSDLLKCSADTVQIVLCNK